MSYLCSIRFDGNGEVFYQHYVVNSGELKKLKNLKHTYEDGCCGQNQCFICIMGGLTVSYHDSKLIRADVRSLFSGQIISLDSLLRNAS